MSEAFLKCPTESFVESLGPCQLVGCIVGWSGNKPDFLLLFEWSPVLVLPIGLFFVAVQFSQESCELLLVSSARLVVFWVPSGVRGLRAIIGLCPSALIWAIALTWFHFYRAKPLVSSRVQVLRLGAMHSTWLFEEASFCLWHDNQVLCDQKNKARMASAKLKK